MAEKIISGFAALVGIGLILITGNQFLAPENLPLVVASMGASAVLLFAVPLGPLSQPWPFVGGHLISAFIGVTCAKLIPELALAATIAVGLAISVMYITRCLHPPGGASALAAVVSGDAVLELGYQFLLTPVLMNIVVMLTWALIINNLLPRRYYPNTLKIKATPVKTEALPEQQAKLKIQRHDLNAVLKELGVYVDISEHDLAQIFNATATLARRQRMGEILCQDIMTKQVVTVQYGDDVEYVWDLLAAHKIRCVPVVDKTDKVIGIVTIADFLNEVKKAENKPLLERVAHFIKKTPGMTTDKPEFAGHLMTSPAITVKQDQHILDLFSVFYQNEIHHLPVVDQQNKLVGMITPKDVLIALHADISQFENE